MAMREADAGRAHDGRRGVEMAAVSDRGGVRAENQDAALLVELEGLGCAVLVADGMGGHPDGRLAADLATAAAAGALRGSGDPVAAMPAAVEAANQAIAERAVPDERGRSLGTTLVVAVVSGGRATVANVGDSRAYLVRSGTATQVSVDHSWVAEQMRAGLLSEDEAHRHPRRSRVTRALLGDPVEPDLFEVAMRPGDVLVLCSDGLWDALPAARIAELLGGGGALDALVGSLVDAALDAGSTDNVTAAALRALPDD
ncbi:MAG TPA: protein phosphatase 2C domain-containing protein [Candidatus Angelobacter sp.]|jgi:serine/threonine protein phosphatase PrpC|nr:protein phosphatase 2C domain-containing protein [Candidatus Angelobacter sp.]